MTEASKHLSRRALLKEGMAIGGAVLFGGCTTQNEPTTIKPASTPRSSEKVQTKLPELTQEDLITAAKQAMQDFSNVLNITVPENTISRIILITNLKEYQKIIEEEEVDYKPSDEIGRPAISTSEKNSHGKKIYVYKASIDNMSNNLSGDERAKKGRLDFLEHVITHELAHNLAKEYYSQELHELVYSKMFGNTPTLKGKQIEPDVVQGAKVKAIVEGKTKNPFNNLEEAEAVVIESLVTRKRGRPQLASMVNPEDMGIKRQYDLLVDLLKRLGPNLDENIKMLAHLRTQEGGREKFCRKIAQIRNVPDQDQLFFALSVLYVINVGDQKTYQELINPPQTPLRLPS